jgi:hypothetical protein
MSTFTPVLCKNCNSPVEGNYCPECGQAKKTERLTFRNILKDFAEQVTELDTGFLRTLKDLTLQPGHMVRAYVLGQRKPYMRPFQFYLLMLAVYFAFNEVLDIDPMEASNQLVEKMNPSGMSKRQQEAQAISSQLMGKNIKLMLSLLLVTQAFSLRLLYRKSGLYLAEMFVITLFMTGYQYIFFLVASLSVLVLDYGKAYWILYGVVSMGTLIHSTWSIVQFFNGKGIRFIFKASLAVLTSLVFYILFAMVVGMAIGFYSYVKR